MSIRDPHSSGACWNPLVPHHHPAKTSQLLRGLLAGLLTFSLVAVTGCGSGGEVATPAQDIASPSTPTGLTVTVASQSQLNLSWTASTDNVAVAGYHVFRGGTPLKTSTTTSTTDTGLTANLNRSNRRMRTRMSGGVDCSSLQSAPSAEVVPEGVPKAPVRPARTSLVSRWP